MALDPKDNAVHFPLCEERGYRVGQRVTYAQTADSTQRWHPPEDDDRFAGAGTITLIWLGIEEMVTIRDDRGLTVSLAPALGDEITVVP